MIILHQLIARASTTLVKLEYLLRYFIRWKPNKI